jgi:hypothetical protein
MSGQRVTPIRDLIRRDQAAARGPMGRPHGG